MVSAWLIHWTLCAEIFWETCCYYSFLDFENLILIKYYNFKKMLQDWYKNSLYSLYPRSLVISHLLSFALSVSFYKSFERNHWKSGTCQGHPFVKSVSDATIGIAEHWWSGRAPEVKSHCSYQAYICKSSGISDTREIMTNGKSI